MQLQLDAPAAVRRLKVIHANRYSYDQPVNRSTHTLHLRPIHDRRQSLISYRLSISAQDTQPIEYEDVFGNWTTRFEVNQPYDELSIVAESVVELLDVDPFAFTSTPVRPMFPILWMPWELKMLAAYLSPIELAETQLMEIRDFAMQFVAQNNNDVWETLFAINLALFHDFTYVPGSTSLETTPFDVLTTKRGVCQDFANLMICMARMLNIPARYVCGYLYTGNTGESRAQSDASHAWVQLFLPNVGWKGFDPTNGVLPDTNHIRMAVGRHYRDTSPTSGTIYSPAIERLTVDVEVAPMESEPANVEAG